MLSNLTEQLNSKWNQLQHEEAKAQFISRKDAMRLLAESFQAICSKLSSDDLIEIIIASGTNRDFVKFCASILDAYSEIKKRQENFDRQIEQTNLKIARI